MSKYIVQVPLTIVAMKYFTVNSDTSANAYEMALDEAYEYPTELWLKTGESILETLPELDEVNLRDVVTEVHE